MRNFDKRQERRIKEPAEMPENLVMGRNAVIELLKSGRSVDKVMLAKGAGEGSVTMIEALAKGAGVPVVRVERLK